MNRLLRPIVITAFAAAAALSLAACNGGGYARGIFHGYVVNKTEAEIVDKVGKPDDVDRSDPEAPVLVYRKKTFDVDNENRVDPITVVYLRKKADGGFVSYDIGFRS